MRRRIIQRKHKIWALLLCLPLLCVACEKEPETVTTTVSETITTAEKEPTTTAKPETPTTAKPETPTTAKPETPTTAKPETPTTAEPEIVTTAVPETEESTEAPTEEYISPYHEEYGSAGTLSGTTVVVSIVTNDQNTRWGFTNGGDANAEEDLATILKQKSYLLSGCEWLSGQAASYGTTADFIADWEVYPDLYYEYDSADILVRFDGGKYETQKEYILENIPTDELKKKYRADHIIYIFYFNTTADNEVNPWSLSMTADPMCDRELINVYTLFKGFTAMPVTYAHEMMHCFGAYDLYYKNSAITQEYVDYLTRTDSRDVMFRTYDCEEIIGFMSKLDAYYIGLTDECEDVTRWNLAAAARFR